MRQISVLLASIAAGLSLAGGASAEPKLVTPPSVAGDTSAVGNVLTASPGTWTYGTDVFYQWSRCGQAPGSCSQIDGAYDATYTITNADVGSWLSVLVTDWGGDATQASMNVAAPLQVGGGDTSAPSHPLPGTFLGYFDADPGDVITALDLGWQGAQPMTVTYQWVHCPGGNCGEVPIPGETGSTYTTSPADLGTYFGVVVTATNAFGSRQYTTVLGRPFGMPHLSLASGPVDLQGVVDFTVGSTLTGYAGEWAPSATTLTYEWDRCTDYYGSTCWPIPGATNSTYTLTAADVGYYLAFVVTGQTSVGVDVERGQQYRPVSLTPTDGAEGPAPAPPPRTAPPPTTPPAPTPTAVLQPVSPPATPPVAPPKPSSPLPTSPSSSPLPSSPSITAGATAGAGGLGHVKAKATPKAKPKPKKKPRPKPHP